jgi:glycerol uptake facilitator-like aquaporin
MSSRSTALISEFFGSVFLLLIVVGSGIMGQSLSPGNDALALLANSIATGAGLFTLITVLGPLSGAHFNPAVTLFEFLNSRLPGKTTLGYMIVQFAGAIAGVMLAHALFDQPLLQTSSHVRSTPGLWLSEGIATFGLLAVIGLSIRQKSQQTAQSVALYITSAYWFTSSTSFANPAVTLARTFTDTFAGIAPGSAPAFMLVQATTSVFASMILKKLL